MDNFKGFCNKFLKVLSKGYDRGRQLIDYGMEYEIFFSVYLSSTGSLPELQGMKFLCVLWLHTWL